MFVMVYTMWKTMCRKKNCQFLGNKAQCIGKRIILSSKVMLSQEGRSSNNKAAKISSKGKENFSVTLEDEEMPRIKFCRKMPMIPFL